MRQSTEATVIGEALERVRDAAAKAGVFGAITLRDGALECEAKDSGAPALYRVFEDGGKIWVSLATPDRWLSQSIEQDLLHTGDKLHELMDEELAEQGHRKPCERFEHFRDEAKVFVFRTPIPVDPAAAGGDSGGVEGVSGVMANFLLACEAMFRPLGDMGGGE